MLHLTKLIFLFFMNFLIFHYQALHWVFVTLIWSKFLMWVLTTLPWASTTFLSSHYRNLLSVFLHLKLYSVTSLLLL